MWIFFVFGNIKWDKICRKMTNLQNGSNPRLRCLAATYFLKQSVLKSLENLYIFLGQLAGMSKNIENTGKNRAANSL